MVETEIDITKKKNLKRIMAEQNITQTKLAEMLKTDQGLVSMWLKIGGDSSKNIGSNVIIKLTKVLGVAESEFYKKENDTQKTISSDDPEKTNIITMQHSDVIKRFIDKKYAVELNSALVELEQLSPKAYKKVGNYIQAVLDGVKSVVCDDFTGDIDRRNSNRRQDDNSGHSNGAGGETRRTGKDRRKAG